MSAALLHEFDVIVGLSRRYPGLFNAQCLAELAELIWISGKTGS